MKTGKRSINMDIIRCIALFFVVSIHFYLNSGYYNLRVTGSGMYVMTLFRGVFMTCVPLFLLLTGYLMRQKTLSVSYYKKSIKTLAIYVIVSLICAVYKACYVKQPMSVLYAIKGILDFTNAPYSWYIEMYIGLFLLIPFLNILWNNIPSKSWKCVLVGTMLILSSAGSVVNVYDFTSIAWWGNPAMIDGAFMHLIPDWWKGIYPLTYYFIGCYLNEYGIPIKRKMNVVLLVLSVLLSGGYNLWRSRGICFVNGAWQDYDSLFTVVLAVLIFNLFANMNCEKLPMWTKNLFMIMSNLSLGAYLISWIFDDFIYRGLNIAGIIMESGFGYYFVIVPVVYVCSLCASWCVNVIYTGLGKCVAKVVLR